jgi:hypothetical protein
MAALLCLLLPAAVGCSGGNSAGIENDAAEVNRQPNQWEVFEVAQVDEVGTTLPYVTARPDSDGNVHIAAYSAVADGEGGYYHQINYLVWSPEDGLISREVLENQAAPSGNDGFDQCDQFDFTLDADGLPVFIYPTEEVHEELAYREADIMINFGGGGLWTEYTGGIGYVARNPVYIDGHATANMSVAVDGAGDVHMAYQFFTEGMDSFNFNYPDLFYVHRTRDGLEAELADADYGALEEAVDGNTFSTYGEHNSVGYFCRLLLDPDGRPVIVYGEHPEGFIGTFALKMATRDDNGTWQVETIEALMDEWTIGGVSTAFYEDGSLAVAYALRAPNPEPDNAHRLKFATNQGGEWTTVIVDEATWCGTHCSLAIDSQGIPGIAYYDEQSHSYRDHHFLKYASHDGLKWVTETVEEYGSPGRYNSLWFDADDMPNICSYSDDEDRIFIYRLIDET